MDTRTTDLLSLQLALMQHTQSGVLTAVDRGDSTHMSTQMTAHSMPSSWTKATMLVRCNANIRGHSAMSRPVIETIMELIRRNITPVIPLRGSISASGDLMPLSYVAGAIQGSPDIFMRVPEPDGQVRIITADKALKEYGIAPIVLGPKEGLSLINGTAASAAVASLALHETEQLAVLCQLSTSLASEALAANAEWAHPFIAEVRPHRGQIEVAQNIRSFLLGSRLIYGLESAKDRFKPGLVQERYATRSSPQWVGPQLEDLALAADQLRTELNSTSDNPVINASTKDVHCGANFQATAVTSSTEKTRLCIQMLGKMIFSQTSELINYHANNGLPSNLSADDPSLSFCLKGLDVNMAAYQSELAFLANPVSSHVQSAEMHNQAINSLALVASRYTMQAVELLSLISAGGIYAGCQGVDLRVMHQTFLASFEAPALRLFTSKMTAFISEDTIADTFRIFWKALIDNWYETASLDARERCALATSTISVVLAKHLQHGPVLPISEVHDLQDSLEIAMLEHFCAHRAEFFKAQNTAQYLGRGTKRLYNFVRHELGVPMHQGLVEHPSPQDMHNNMLNGRSKKTIGSWVAIIYEAVRDGRIHDEVMSFVDQHL